MATMNAVRIHTYGGPEVLTYETVTKPEAGDGEVLVRVHAAGVNPFDWKLRQGYLSGFFNVPFPMVIGWEYSGVVESVGAGVTEFAPGDEVYGRSDIMRDGSAAEYIRTPASMVVHKPKSISHTQAAAIPHAVLAAWAALFDKANIQAGQKILIHAAAGGVGSLAVQLAKWKGLYVIGTASLPNSIALLKELGADEIINYKTQRFEDVVKDVDVVLDLVGDETQQRSWSVLKQGGVLVSLVTFPSPETAQAHGVTAHMATGDANAHALTEVARLIDEGTVKPIVAQVFQLKEMQQAHEMSATGHTHGKLILQIVE
jgi:NADPH:quinone reductase-like Zn-dependent oxidoreductase